MNDVQFEIGKLIRAVDDVCKKMIIVESKVDNIQAQINKGKGFIVGMLLAAGGIGAGVTTVLQKWFK